MGVVVGWGWFAWLMGGFVWGGIFDAKGFFLCRETVHAELPSYQYFSVCIFPHSPELRFSKTVPFDFI